MILLEINGSTILILFLLVSLAWIIPIGMLIIGISRLKSRPKNAKTLIIFAGVWLTIGLGYCGSMMS